MENEEIKLKVKMLEKEIKHNNRKNNILLIVVAVLCLVNYFIFIDNNENNKDHKVIKSYASDTSNSSSNSGIAYMVETGPGTGVYEQASDNTWPTDPLIEFNASKSACENGSTLLFDNSTRKLTINTTKTDKCFVYFNKFAILYNKVLADNGGSSVISAKTAPNFNTISTTNDGMYAAADDYGTSYYFRGAVNNNWVKFANMYWRIIRINGDNTVRMIYSGTTAPTEAQATIMIGTGTQINGTTYEFNTNYNSAEYAGYMYTLGSQHGYGTSSTIKNVLDAWYTNNLASYASKIADNEFCNDRSTYSGTIGGYTYTGTGVGTTNTWFGGAGRIVAGSTSSWSPGGTGPTLKCPTQSDAFTVSDTTKGNGHLTNPIGLITADELNMAGGIYGTSNNSYYLYTGQLYWTGSPFSYRGSVNEFGVNAPGDLSYSNFVVNVGAARGVVSLTSAVVTTGTGTYNDPYVIQ